MPKITVTGSTGNLGNLIIESLLKRGVQPGMITASTREVSKADHHRARGIKVCRGDYDDPASLMEAFAETDHLLMISGNIVGQRVEQHRRAVEAARAAGVKHIVYTSLVSLQNGGEEVSPLAKDHRPTEAMIIESGIPYTILRNTFYAEYMLAPVISALDRGVFVSSVGDAQLGAAARTDLAEAAAVVLSEPGHENKIYELTYPRPWNYREAVAVVSKVSGKPLDYQPVSAEELAQILRQAGMPEEAVQGTIGMNSGLGAGHLSHTTGDLEQLLGRPVTSLEALVQRMLAQ